MDQRVHGGFGFTRSRGHVHKHSLKGDVLFQLVEQPLFDDKLIIQQLVKPCMGLVGYNDGGIDCICLDNRSVNPQKIQQLEIAGSRFPRLLCHLQRFLLYRACMGSSGVGQQLEEILHFCRRHMKEEIFSKGCLFQNLHTIELKDHFR